MESLRLNGLAMIHKALRTMLYDAAMNLQHTNFADTAHALPVMNKVARVVELFEDHAYHEDNVFFPAAAMHNPQLAAELEAEHVTDKQLCEKLNSYIQEYAAAATQAEKIKAGNKVFYAFNDFIAFNLVHMNKEETVLHETMWANYTDEEIMGLNRKIAAAVTPEIAAENVKWMMRGANNMEIINFIKGFKSAPGPLYSILMQHAENELPAHRWQHVKEQMEETMPA